MAAMYEDVPGRSPDLAVPAGRGDVRGPCRARPGASPAVPDVVRHAGRGGVRHRLRPARHPAHRLSTGWVWVKLASLARPGRDGAARVPARRRRSGPCWRSRSALSCSPWRWSSTGRSRRAASRLTGPGSSGMREVHGLDEVERLAGPGGGRQRVAVDHAGDDRPLRRRHLRPPVDPLRRRARHARVALRRAGWPTGS